MNSEVKLTPMMEQWKAAKDAHPDAILLFRMGDFYELFGDDAVKAAPILELTLTSRDKDKSGLKMAGFPFHAADNYIYKLVERGLKVAICEQLEDPKTARGVVKRGITNVVTPGTVIENENAPHAEPAYLIGLASMAGEIALCSLDLATASFRITSTTCRDSALDEALRLEPRELVVLERDHVACELSNLIKHRLRRSALMRVEKKTQLATKSFQTFAEKVSFSEAELSALSLITSYVTELKGAFPSHVAMPSRYAIHEQLLMDLATRTNLDLFPKKKGDHTNLFSVLDETKTAMGRRLLCQSIAAPSTSLEKILERQQLVEELLEHSSLRATVRELLSATYDLEKLTALVTSKKISPRGLARVRDCLLRTHELVTTVFTSSAALCMELLGAMPDLSSLRALLSHALADEPPLFLRDGGVFREGFDPHLDELMHLLQNGKNLLLDLESKERQQTGIPSLRIKFTRVFGYYIEVTKTHMDKVPAHYQRKQTIANGERYVTKELSELEVKINTAQAKAQELEEQRFTELCAMVAKEAPALIAMARTLALFDLTAGFAELASVRAYSRPQVLEQRERVIDIKAGRHPIVEDIGLREGSYFVPNDTLLVHDECNLMLITGPNMAGKSTVMRQVALIQIMAQIGSFVPAASARLSLCDAIFARVGASDDLATGRSTFMVEMSETAAILSNATEYSLILLDEIGRGTSTYDGMSIAQAVAEYIHDTLKSRTLFATHYHELTELEKRLKGMRNFHVEVTDHDNEVRFLYTLAHGACLKSFGIEVAKLSGLPRSVLDRAHEVLMRLENSTSRAIDHAPTAPSDSTTLYAPEPSSLTHTARPQMDLFVIPKAQPREQGDAVLEKIRGVDINRMTPLQALSKIASWQAELLKK